VHLLVAGYLGFKPRRNRRAAPSELLRHGFAETGDVHDGFESAAVLDFAVLKERAAKRRRA
jgi:hypothetical protein